MMVAGYIHGLQVGDVNPCLSADPVGSFSHQLTKTLPVAFIGFRDDVFNSWKHISSILCLKQSLL